MKQPRVFVVGDHRLFDALGGEGNQRIKLVTHRDEWGEVEKNALIIALNTSMKINEIIINPLNPTLCIEWNRQNAFEIITGNKKPPQTGQPWQPPTVIHCDPDQSRLPQFSRPFLHPCKSDLSLVVRIGKIRRVVEKRLLKKLFMERRARHAGKSYAFAMKPREPYIKGMIKEILANVRNR